MQKTLNVSYKGTDNIEITINGPLFIYNFSFGIFTPVLISLIARTDKINPITNEPVSPINILAGLKLNFRNANNEPRSVKERIAI